jgi:Family of unknown function (DUF5994)
MKADSNTPRPPPRRLLPDAVHRNVAPGVVLLRLETTRSREGILDGAWWPRSRDIGVQLPGLVSSLTKHLGPIARVGLDADAWDDVPGRMIIDGRVVHIDWYPVGDDTVLITRGDQDHFVLLVVPPDTTPSAAHEAMSRAVQAGNITAAQQILIETATEPALTDSPAARNTDSPAARNSERGNGDERGNGEPT